MEKGGRRRNARNVRNLLLDVISNRMTGEYLEKHLPHFEKDQASFTLLHSSVNSNLQLLQSLASSPLSSSIKTPPLNSL